MVRYPLMAPICLTVAGAGILAGTLDPAQFAAIAFTWVVPLAFFGLTLVMWDGGMLSYLMLLGNMLGLTGSVCTGTGLVAANLPAALPACDAVANLPPLTLPLLAVAAPASLVFRFGPDDPCLTTWLASTVVACVPALPADVQAIVWQPGFVSAIIIFINACAPQPADRTKPRPHAHGCVRFASRLADCMMRTRSAPAPPPAAAKKADKAKKNK